MKILTALALCAASMIAAIPDADAGGRGGSSPRGARAIDGDTYRYQGERHRIQQYNAPERGQPGASQATKSLQRRLDSGKYEYKPVGKDVYGRTVVREQRAR